MRPVVTNRLHVLGVLVSVLVVSLAACGNDVPSQASGDTVSPQPSVTTVVPASSTAAELPDLTATPLTATPPPGTLLTSTQGTGGHEVTLSALATGSHTMTIRFACTGTTGAQLTDQAGGLVLGVSGCDGTTIYSTDFTSSANDRGLRVGVGPNVSWVIAVWAT